MFIDWQLYPNDTLIGFCCGQLQKSICYPNKIGELTEMYVMEDRRRLGVGRQLVNLLEMEFVKRGAGSIRLLTGRKNEEAKAFYCSCGYELEPDEIVMEKIM